MIFSNVIAFFIILTTAAVLNADGITNINSATQAAEALRPLAGDFTFLLFALGIIGTGMLAIPVLAGSAAYGVSEAFGWPATLEAKAPDAVGFYTIIAAATVIGFGLGFTGIDAIHMLVWSAVLNGIVAVPIMAMMMVIVANSTTDGPVQGQALADRAWLDRHRPHGFGRGRANVVFFRRLEPISFRQNRNGGSTSLFEAFSSREPVSTSRKRFSRFKVQNDRSLMVARTTHRPRARSCRHAIAFPRPAPSARRRFRSAPAAGNYISAGRCSSASVRRCGEWRRSRRDPGRGIRRRGSLCPIRRFSPALRPWQCSPSEHRP